MGTFTAKVLADGQLPSSKGTIYTVPGATKAFVRNLRVFSTGAAQTIVIYLNTSGTSRRIAQWLLDTNEWADDFDSPLELEAGDLIEGESTNATTVDYVLMGVEQS